MMETQQKIGKMIDLVFKALAMAMAVAVIVTNVLGGVEPQTQMLMVGICLFGLAITALDKE